MPVKDTQFDQRIAQAKDIDWARLAAYIDGEGTIYINRNKARKPTQSPRHFLCVSVTSTSPLLMEWLTSTFGGTVYSVKPTLGKKAIMRWQLNETRGAKVLSGCLPYLIIKRSQAEVGLAFQRLKLANSQSRAKVPAEVIAQRDSFVEKIHLLNRSELNSKTIA